MRRDGFLTDLEALYLSLDAMSTDTTIRSGAALLWYVQSKRHG